MMNPTFINNDFECEELHPYFRFVKNKTCNEIQQQKKRTHISKYAETWGYEFLRMISETFESSVAQIRKKDALYFLKSFHTRERYEAEISGLFHLQGVQVPALIDTCPESQTICMAQVDGTPLSHGAELKYVFEFLAGAHDAGAMSLMELKLPEPNIAGPLQRYCINQRIGTTFSFNIGDHNPSNYLVTPNGAISRIDLATFEIGVPITLDILKCLWNMFDVYDYREPSVEALLEHYGQRSRTFGGEQGMIRMCAELDMVATFFDPRANNFFQHICHLQELRSNHLSTIVPNVTS